MKFIKDAADWVEAGGTRQALENMVVPTQTWQPPKGSQLLDDIAAFIRKYMVLSQQQTQILVLWIIHTYVISASDVTPYISINSCEKRCGKTLLLEILAMLVCNPWLTGRVTPAVLSRKIDAEHPTLLLDEADTAFSGDPEYNSTLHGILNTGYRRGGISSICVGQGANIGIKDLSTFCPKAIAGIGDLPDTIADRSISIRLKRKLPEEKVKRFRHKKVLVEAQNIQNRIYALVSQLENNLEQLEPMIPDSLNDRAADCIEPLLAIADIVGDGWPDKARRAAIALMGDVESEESLGIKLLADIRNIFATSSETISTKDLISKLLSLEESPWNDLKGKPITAPKIAALLNPFGTRPGTIRNGVITYKGYKEKDFEDTWKRYLKPVTPSHPGSNDPNNERNNDPSQNTNLDTNVTDNSRSCSEANCAGVTASPAQSSTKRTFPVENAPQDLDVNGLVSEWEDEI